MPCSPPVGIIPGRPSSRPGSGAAVTAVYYTVQLPMGAGDVRYFIEAEDSKGNVSRSALERVYLA